MNHLSSIIVLCVALNPLTRGHAQEQTLSFAFPTQEKEFAFENKLTLKEMKQKIPYKEIRYFDPLLRKPKVYLTFPIAQVLDAGFGKDWRNAMYSDVELESAGGKEKATTKTYLLKDDGGFLAFQDLDVKTGWEYVKSVNGTSSEMNPGPFYLFWINADRTTSEEYPWFLSLTKLRLFRFEDQYPLVTPRGVKTDSDVYRGYAIFRSQCFKCHSINRQGGKIGPDLNAPQSVTAYREPKMIKAFIKQPSKYRYSNMPDFDHLTEAELDDLIAFFKFKDKNRTF